jgi:hypothetical protein
MVSITPLPPYPWDEKNSGSVAEKAGRSHGLSRRYREKRNVMPMAGIEPRISLVTVLTEFIFIMKLTEIILGPWGLRQKSRSLSPALPRGGPGSTPDQLMSDMWLTKWHWGQVFSECFRFPCQFSFHRLLHTRHHPSSGAGTVGQIVTDLPIALSLTPPHEIKRKIKTSLSAEAKFLSYPIIVHTFSGPVSAGVKQPGREADNSLPLVPGSNVLVHGSIHPLPHTPSWLSD